MKPASATILIVDDELQNRRLLEALLLPEGYRTLTAADGEAALACVEREAPDLILLDVMMPAMDGYQVARSLKANPATSNIPIILVTSLDDRNARLTGLEAGAEDFLTKPVDRAELWLRTRNLLRLKTLGDFLQNHNAILEQQVQARTADLQRFHTAMDTSTDAIYLVSRQSMRFVEVNTTACEMLGYTREELLQSSPTLIMGRTRAELELIYDQIIASGHTNTVEVRIARKDGSHFDAELRRQAQCSRESCTIVCVLRDITERKRAADALEIERSSLVIAQRIGKIGSWETDIATSAVVWSDETHRIHETDPATFRPTHPGFLEKMHPEDRASVEGAFSRSLEQHGPNDIEHRLLLTDGRIKFVEERWQVFFDQQGHPLRAVGTCQDITERKHSEIKIERLNRVYAVISQINALIVRVRDRDELFHEACRIAVEVGGFRLAWIGMVDSGARKIVPIASAGADREILDRIGERLSLHDNAILGHGPAALAVRNQHAVIVNDVATDPRIRHAASHVDRSALALVSLPLIVEGVTVAVFSLHATTRDYFDAAEMTLLDSLSNDLAHAIDYIEKQERIVHLAFYDDLTGLANRTLFVERVAQHMHGVDRGGRKLALLVFDLERFKNINDSLGRPAGDALLKLVAQWLTHNAGDAALVSRVGADRFAAVVPEIQPDADLTQLIENTMADFSRQPFVLDEAVLRVASKVGVALFPDDGDSAEVLFMHAEAALNKAKASGDRHLFYSPSMTDKVGERLAMENQLRRALENDEFVLHFQPKISLATGKLTGAEALIRWNDPKTGLVAPGQFIPLLEETGLIHEVGRWALRKAVENHLRWRNAGFEPIRIAVNVSPLQLRNRAFAAEIEAVLAIDADASSGLELEITENVIMQDIKYSIDVLQEIRAQGVTIAIDDFGTGFSSLAYLSRLPVDTLKIDRSFVNEMVAGPDGLTLVSTIIMLARSLRLKVVAEGVETVEQQRLLRLLQCEEMQGFLFSKPVPSDIFEANFLASRQDV